MGASLAVLFLERDLGASMLFFGVFVVMLWVASGRAALSRDGGHPVRGGRVDRIPGSRHVQHRVDVLAARARTGDGPQVGYGQLAQSWFALASGGLVGTGLGRGRPT